MSDLTLYIANKNYSSWSFRPWIALKAKDVPFQEVLIPFDDAAGNPKFKEVSPTGKMPALRHGDLCVWESLAILEHLADFFPEMHFWPEGIEERAVARSISTEMATGFRALRSRCPMNMRRKPAPMEIDAGVRADVARIEDIWTARLERSGGPFLFGTAFGAADAMFAPVVNRFDIYRLSDKADVLAYMDAVKGVPAWQEWENAAREEPWTVADDEV